MGILDKAFRILIMTILSGIVITDFMKLLGDNPVFISLIGVASLIVIIYLANSILGNSKDNS
jgi:hypothetical protein